MSVRPLSKSEQKLSDGAPVSGIVSLIGASQGLLMHLRYNNLTISSKNLMPTPFAKATLPAFVIGGYFAGYSLGYLGYGDETFRRLKKSHARDYAYKVESQRFDTTSAAL